MAWRAVSQAYLLYSTSSLYIVLQIMPCGHYAFYLSPVPAGAPILFFPKSSLGIGRFFVVRTHTYVGVGAATADRSSGRSPSRGERPRSLVGR
ncbi:hypothetical protein CTAM01_05391 [Colletotrichum tamarilloi]|uniref:Secreted protein n=1 Tax=Colletotrichum tamarilloi TaxID=1209934 RepID=A0ABQ9RFH8_9PEZI|nr:uncharacterized protein CTAM01_05391 [Colletotrichum tamarilloi]KAK1502578.1 hypothetical protein CTAM01_05391 [Colletotrichum tamarilloi]